MDLISTVMSDFWESQGDNSYNRKIHATYNHYSCPLIDTGGIILDLNVGDVSHDRTDPVKRYWVFQSICPVREDNYWKSTSNSV